MSVFVRAAALGAVVTAPIGAYILFVRPWIRRWGVSSGDAGTVLPGDGLVDAPTVVDTRSITIDAAPGDVWPWLVQMGYGRAGWYSYDQLDQDGRSADEIASEWQGLAVGDVVPTHPSGGFVVKALEPERALVLYVDGTMVEEWRAKADRADRGTAGIQISGAALGATVPRDFAGSWAFVLQPTAEGRTRLVERLRFRFPGPQAVGADVVREALGFGVFLMMRKQMLGLRDRAEGLAAARLPVPVAPAFESLAT